MDGAKPWAGGGMGGEIWQLEVLERWCGKPGCPQDCLCIWGRNGSPQKATSFIVGRERRGDRLYRGLKALRSAGCQEVINTCLGFFNNSRGGFFELEQSWMGTRGHQPRVRGFVPSRSVPRRGRAGQGVLEQCLTGRGRLASPSSEHPSPASSVIPKIHSKSDPEF